MSDHSGGQRQCWRSVTVDVELDAAMALADMAGVGPVAPPAGQARPLRQAPSQLEVTEHDDDEELASTRLSLELGRVGIRSSPCSSSSSARRPAQQAPVAAAATGYGPRPRHMLTEAEKEAKRQRRVLANRESARRTILRRQAIRDELARKVADLSSENESMKKEKETAMQQYLSLKETNRLLEEQVAKKTKKASAPIMTTAMDTAPPAQQAEAMTSAASPPPTPLQPSFLYTAPPPAVPVPYFWGSWPPGYEHGNPGAPPLFLRPCAWYYPVVGDPRGSPTSYVQPFQESTSGGGGSTGGGTTAEEDTDDDPCSLTLALDVDKKSAPSTKPDSRVVGLQDAMGDREKTATAAEARKNRKELTKLKQMHAGGGRPGGEQS